jgi:DNA helicase-2/ATP-dependent DNA helicase PcrA
VPVTIVVDDDQSILSFLGSVEHGMQHFIEDYPSVEVFKLEQNYRSSAQIIAASNKLISHNRKRIDKTLFTDNPPGEQPVHQHLSSDHDEARLVVDKIESLLSAGTPHHEIAVLYRNNAFNRTFEKELAHRGIPYRIVGDVSFYKRTEINLVMGSMKAALNPENQIDLVKVLKFARIGVGDKKIDDARAYMTEHNVGFREALIETLPTRLTELLTERVFAPLERIARDDEYLQATVSESIRAIYEVFDLKKLVVEAYKSKPGNEDAEVDAKAERRAVNMEELFDAAVRFETTYRDASGQIAAPMLQDFLDYCIISADLSQHEESRINLMTLHKAKGLEFDHVFLPCFDDSIMPGRDALGLDDDPDDETLENMEEARRLAYVGLTRARQGLYLYSAANRWVNGETRSGDPSRFLAEMAPVVRVALQGFEIQPRSVLAQHPTTAKPGQGSAEPPFDYEIPFDATPPFDQAPPFEPDSFFEPSEPFKPVIASVIESPRAPSNIPRPGTAPPPPSRVIIGGAVARPILSGAGAHPIADRSTPDRAKAMQQAPSPPSTLFTNTILPPPRRPKHG